MYRYLLLKLIYFTNAEEVVVRLDNTVDYNCGIENKFKRYFKKISVDILPNRDFIKCNMLLCAQGQSQKPRGLEHFSTTVGIAKLKKK